MAPKLMNVISLMTSILHADSAVHKYYCIRILGGYGLIFKSAVLVTVLAHTG